VKALGTVFRAKFLEALAQAHTTAALTFSDTTAALATPQSFAHLLDQLYATAWVVYAKAPFEYLS
jgi:Putative transposase